MSKKSAAQPTATEEKVESKLFVAHNAADKTVKNKTSKKSLPPIEEYLESRAEEGEEEQGGKIAMIMHLFGKGYTRKEIIAAGFNQSTVYRQTCEYMKMKKEPALRFHGLELYEARIQRMMRIRSLNREQAINVIAEKDLEA
jgi:hypothetical protein